MLVITRREGQRLVFGDPLNPLGTVEIVRIEGGKVRVGATFPTSIAIHREEIAEVIVAEAKGKKVVGGEKESAA